MIERPVIKITPSRLDWTVEIISAAALATTMILVLFYYRALPDKIPSHYDMTGQPDSYGTKTTMILLACIGIFLYAILTIVSRFPHVFNYPVEITETNAAVQYDNAIRMLRYIKLVIVCQFAYLTYSSMMIARGDQSSLGVVFLPMSLVLLFGVISIFIVKAYKYK